MSPLRSVELAALKAEKKAQREKAVESRKSRTPQLMRALEAGGKETEDEATFRHIQAEEDAAWKQAVELSIQAAKDDEAIRSARMELPRSAFKHGTTAPPPLLKRSSSGRMRASAHLHSPQAQEKDKKSTSMARCPVCDGPFPMAQVDSHLDTCLTERALEDDPDLVKSQSTQELDSSVSQSATSNPKKRPLETRDGDDAMHLSPPTKKLADSISLDNDCMIIGESGFESKHSYYYSDGEDDEEMDEDRLQDASDEDDDRNYKRSVRDIHKYHHLHQYPQQQGSVPKDAQSPLRSSAPAQFHSTVLPTAPPSSPPHAPAAAPSAPQVVIPNSGGLFNIVQFTTPSELECPICFEEFRPGQIGIRLTCLCLYHDKCISSWLQRKPRNCPSHGDY